jgi:putative DNA primase/helicase
MDAKKTVNQQALREHQALIKAARLDYAARGWDTFPGELDAKKSYKAAQYSNGRAWGKSRDPAEIESDSEQWPQANVGVATGAESGILVIETDTADGHGEGVDGEAALAELELRLGKLPDTTMALSPSGSKHRYFQHPGEDIRIPNSASVLAPGVDVRGDGGMVFAPPSLRRGGKRYVWAKEIGYAELPEAWVEALRGPPQRDKTTSSNKKPRTDAELHELLEETRIDGKWHNNMLLVTATLIGRGRSDSEIRLVCAPYFRDGFTDQDFAALLDKARVKWNKSNEDTFDTAEIDRLALLSALDYEQQRKEVAKTLGLRTSVLDMLVKARRKALGLDTTEDDERQGHKISFVDIQPWPDVVDGAALLDTLATTLRSHVVFDDAARDTAALWTVHTYLLDMFMITPRLGVVSPVKRCGKTTLLDVLGCLVRRPLLAANVSAATVFRVIEMCQPCLLIDEADTFLGVSDELRGVLNSGHRKGGQVLRTVGEEHEPRAFTTYGACAIALIKSLPDTLHDRAVRIELKRRLKSEPIVPFRLDRTGHLHELARKTARWAADNSEAIGELEPVMPEGVDNRAADNWRPLLAIADAAGGDWPERARQAATAAAGNEGEGSKLELLLGDIKTIFAEHKKQREKDQQPNSDRITSAELVEALYGIEGHPWREMGKLRKPLTQHQLAAMLKPLGIAPITIRISKTETPRGYLCFLFDDAFARFCPD